MNEKDGETVIDLFELLGVFVKRIWLPIITTVSGAILALIITLLFITPLYKSSALLYVNNSDFSLGSVSISTADLSAAKSLVSTYSVILKSRTVINEVKELSGVNYTYDEMIDMVEAKSVENTEVFSITVTSSDPKEAEMLANLFAKVLPEKISEIVNGSEPKVVDYAVVAAKRSSPSYLKNTAIGAVLGFAIATIIIVISYLRDDIIHSEEYITKTYPNIPLLTVVPDLINTKSDGYGYYKTSSKNSSSSQKQ
ncbi:MAG: hypothetical protein IKG30_10375 [Clostridiales bacterium]|nr:hypothetical protein [Clostridiales bacterium]